MCGIAGQIGYDQNLRGAGGGLEEHAGRSAAETLFLAQNRMGVKLLFFALLNGGGLVFASRRSRPCCPAPIHSPGTAS